MIEHDWFWAYSCSQCTYPLPATDVADSKEWSRSPSRNRAICKNCGGHKFRPSLMTVRWVDQHVWYKPWTWPRDRSWEWHQEKSDLEKLAECGSITP